MKIGVFLSHPRPMTLAQSQFIEELVRALDEPYRLNCHTLGVDYYDMDAPMTAIRRVMLEANGVLVVAFRRYWVQEGAENHGCDVPGRECRTISGKWMTSPWCHIEAAMGFQLGLPLLVLRETGVLADGLLDRGVRGGAYPEFDLSAGGANPLGNPQLKNLLPQWCARVRGFRESRGVPGPFAG